MENAKVYYCYILKTFIEHFNFILIKDVQLKQHISCLETCNDRAEFCKYQPDCKIEEVGLQCPRLCRRCKAETPAFLYLTFDDGPNEGTPNVLRALKVR